MMQDVVWGIMDKDFSMMEKLFVAQEDFEEVIRKYFNKEEDTNLNLK